MLWVYGVLRVYGLPRVYGPVVFWVYGPVVFRVYGPVVLFDLAYRAVSDVAVLFAEITLFLL